MIFTVKQPELEIEIPADIAVKIAKEEILNGLDESLLVSVNCPLHEFVKGRIYRIISAYDKGKMDYIREQLGISDQEEGGAK